MNEHETQKYQVVEGRCDSSQNHMTGFGDLPVRQSELDAARADLARLREERDEARKSYETMYENCRVNVQKRGELEVALIALRSAVEGIVQEWRSTITEARDMKAMALPEDADFLEGRANIMESCADQLSTLVDESRPKLDQ